jgi:hypothetical protein
MVWPILISLSETPGPYFFSADQAASRDVAVTVAATIMAAKAAEYTGFMFVSGSRTPSG